MSTTTLARVAQAGECPDCHLTEVDIDTDGLITAHDVPGPYPNHPPYPLRPTCDGSGEHPAAVHDAWIQPAGYHAA